MDLIRRARRWALRQPRVLLVAAPDEQRARWTVEAELDRRGWPQAMSPADTDLLLVVGHSGPQLSESIEVLWSQVPFPRYRTSWDGETALQEVLDRAAGELVGAAERRPVDDARRPDPETLLSARADDSAGHAGTQDPGHGSDQGRPAGMDHGGLDHSQHGGHGGHGGMDHAGMEHAQHAAQGQDGVDQHASHREQAEHGEHGIVDHGGMDHPQHGGGPAHEDMDHGGEDQPQHADHGGHGGMDHDGGMNHGGHGGHGGMDVAGLPMAETAPDRDGLELDELKVSLGPVLPGWPAGLVLEARLQGDVLTGVELRWLDEEDPGSHLPEIAKREPRMALDVLAGFLLVAGWARVAAAARRARDGIGSADPIEAEAARREADRLARRVRRSRTLAWNLRGLGGLQGTDGQETDLLDRIRSWCEIAAGDSKAKIPTPSLSDLAAGLEGAELGAARLVIASLGLPHAVSRPHEVAGV